jgi:type VI secretion system ImpM family protein
VTGVGASAVGIFGKVPWREEYLRLHAQAEPFAKFDAWLTECIEWAAARALGGWGEAYRAGRINAFAFRPRDAGVGLLAGAMGPSWDGAGRAFPLVVATTVAPTAELGRCPETLPLLLEEFWQRASDLVDQVKSAQALEWVEHLAAATATSWSPAVEVLASYEQWACTLPLAELWTLIYGRLAASQSAAALRIVLHALRPCVGIERPKTPLTLRLPLGAAGGAAVCFWIDLVRRAARWGATIPSFFWSHDGTNGAMLLHLGDPPRSTLAELWMPSAGRDEFCDLTLPITKERVDFLPVLPAAVARLFDGGEHPVAELVRAAASLGS